MKKLVVVFILFFFSLVQINGQEKQTDSLESATVPFVTIDEVPIFPGCEKFKDNLERRKCFNEQVLNHIRANFSYPKKAVKQKLQGRVSLIFTVDTKGDVVNIRTRGPHAILENEARRIISLLPRMVPGKQRGKTVRVPFSIPINFALTKKKNKRKAF